MTIVAKSIRAYFLFQKKSNVQSGYDECSVEDGLVHRSHSEPVGLWPDGDIRVVEYLAVCVPLLIIRCRLVG